MRVRSSDGVVHYSVEIVKDTRYYVAFCDLLTSLDYPGWTNVEMMRWSASELVAAPATCLSCMSYE